MSRLRHQLPPDFEPFFQNSLRFYFEAASVLRLSFGKQMLRFMLAGIIAFVALTVGNNFGGVGLIFSVGLAVLAVYWVFTNPSFKPKTYKVSIEQMRQQAYGEMVRFLSPQMQFTVRAPQMDKEVRETQLFPKLDFIQERNCIAGSVGGRLMATVGLNAGVYVQTTDSNGKSRTEAKTLFHGMFMAVEFPRKFEGWVSVHRDTVESKFGWIATELQKLTDSNTVRLENSAFESQFKVRASDPVVAHYVLSSSSMDRVLNLQSHFSDSPFLMSFKDSVMYFALPMEHRFDLGGADGEEWLASAKKDADYICCILDILAELEIAQNIWDGKETA